MSRNIETITAIYAAFERQDMPAILSHLAEDVDWMNFDDNRAADAGIPWFIRRHGRAEVPKFFEALASHLTFERVQVGPIAEGDGVVAARFSFIAHFPDGTRIEQQDVHWWTLNSAAKVTSYRHYTDTAEAIGTWQTQRARAA